MENKPKLPALIDLYSEVDIAKFSKSDALNYLLNQQPKKEWVRKNSMANNSEYIPIGIVETLLQKIFKQYKVEILREGTMFNSVYATIRLHYIDPTTGLWSFHDGTGAQELQTKKESGALKPDFSNINRGAVMMALPIAVSFAIKDAADHFGKLFGRDLNRKDVIEYKLDSPLDIDKQNVIKERKRIVEHIAQITDLNDLELFDNMCAGFDVSVELEEKRKQLTKTK